MSKGLLIVEGNSDKIFFERLLSKSNINNVDVDVVTPRECDAKDNGKGYIKSALKKQITDNAIDTGSAYNKIACIVDADYIEHDPNHKIDKWLQKLLDDIPREYFNSFELHLDSGGYYLKSNNGLNPIGIWFMPNNSDEGMLEDWLLKVAPDAENRLIEYSQSTRENSPKPHRFEAHHHSKVDVALWMALQKKPDWGISNIFDSDLINKESSAYKNLISWLNFIFK